MHYTTQYSHQHETNSSNSGQAENGVARRVRALERQDCRADAREMQKKEEAKSHKEWAEKMKSAKCSFLVYTDESRVELESRICDPERRMRDSE